MLYLGIVIASAAAVIFILVGALSLFGGADATQRQIIPGFIPDRLSPAQQIVTLFSVWLPIVIVTLFCLLTGIQIVRVILAALI